MILIIYSCEAVLGELIKILDILNHHLWSREGLFLVNKYYCNFKTFPYNPIRQSIVLIRMTTVIQEKTQCNYRANKWKYIHL